MAPVSRLDCSQYRCLALVETSPGSLRTVLHTGAGGQIFEEWRARGCQCLAGPTLWRRMRTAGHSIGWDWGPEYRNNHFPWTVISVTHYLALTLLLLTWPRWSPSKPLSPLPPSPQGSARPGDTEGLTAACPVARRSSPGAQSWGKPGGPRSPASQQVPSLWYSLTLLPLPGIQRQQPRLTIDIVKTTI